MSTSATVSARPRRIRKSSDTLVAEYAHARLVRDDLRRQRGACFCERAEPVSHIDHAEAASEAKTDPLATFVFPEQTQDEACWKAARKWEDDFGARRTRFYFDPPLAEWCATCRRRQELTEQLREAVRRHAGALRGLLARGLVLNRHLSDSVPNGGEQ